MTEQKSRTPPPDQSIQRLAMVGIGLAVWAALLSYAGDFLQRAGFIQQVPAGLALWLVMGMLWMLSLVGASRYYR